MNSSIINDDKNNLANRVNKNAGIVTVEKKRKNSDIKSKKDKVVKIKIEGESEKKENGRGGETTWAQKQAILECLEERNRYIMISKMD